MITLLPSVHSDKENHNLARRREEFTTASPPDALECWHPLSRPELHRGTAAQQGGHIWSVSFPQQWMAHVLFPSLYTYFWTGNFWFLWKVGMSNDYLLKQTCKGCRTMKDFLITTHMYWFTLHCIAELYLSSLHREKCTKNLVVFWQLLTASSDLGWLAEWYQLIQTHVVSYDPWEVMWYLMGV